MPHSVVVTCPYARITMRSSLEPVCLHDTSVWIKNTKNERRKNIWIHRYIFLALSLCLPSTATSQVYVTQQLVPAMQYQPYYPGCAPVQSVHVGQPYLAPPPAYLDASKFHLCINCCPIQTKNIAHDLYLFSDKMANQFYFCLVKPVWPTFQRPGQQMLPSQPYVPPPPQPTEAVQLPYNPAYVPSVLTGSHIWYLMIALWLKHHFWSSAHLGTPDA